MQKYNTTRGTNILEVVGSSQIFFLKDVCDTKFRGGVMLKYILPVNLSFLF